MVRKVEGKQENRKAAGNWDEWGILGDRLRKWRWFGPTLSGLIGGCTFSVLLSLPWRWHQDPSSHQGQKCHFQFQTAGSSGRNAGKEGHTAATVLGLQGSADSSPCHAWDVTPGSSSPALLVLVALIKSEINSQKCRQHGRRRRGDLTAFFFFFFWIRFVSGFCSYLNPVFG